MSSEKLNISQIDFKELKKNLFPLMKLLKKINDGKKKKGLNAADDIQSIKNKIEFIANNSDILLNKKFKYLYASLCLLQIQNNSYLNELKNINKKRQREEPNEVEEIEENSVESNSSSSNNNKKLKLTGKDNTHQNDKKSFTTEINANQYLERIQEKNSQKKKSKKKGKEINSGYSSHKSNPELKKVNHWIDMMEFVKYCKQKPYSKEALFPVLPLKTSEEDELSLFSRLENTTEEKMEQAINSFANQHKDFYNRCWKDLQKKENEEEEEDYLKTEKDLLKYNLDSHEEEEEKGNTKNKKDRLKEASTKSNKKNKNVDFLGSFFSDEDEDEDDIGYGNEDDYTDYLPNQVYRSRIWTDGIMERFRHLLEEKRKKDKDSNTKRIKVCTECLSRFHRRLNHIPCTGESPCERCKRLGLICYYPVLVKPSSVKSHGTLYRLKENINNPLTHQEYDERYEMEEFDALMRHYNNHIEFRNTAYKRLINDAHIVGDREDYLQYRLNSKIGFWIKSQQKDKDVQAHIPPLYKRHENEMEKEQNEMENNGEKPFLGKTISNLPTSELIDSLQYCVAKRVNLEKKNESMTFKYDGSALITLGVLYEEILKYEIKKFNQPNYYQ
ncbi:hypothetical protein BCR36DRAFT_401945 [Piromyces finnis]|uniref:Uncharacterized protein n=1 Tax=Piromyces finnis TaxID=1754191 RepID=A0A1Y1VLQ3_9FUNG|nr:hypothetical protein BCR36DRAFT_401945 [Piromyces finnis]|eukprot:ORX58417.1 hypothetical protein BCR36DRAFT_401945 [Piromyces finnis]